MTRWVVWNEVRGCCDGGGISLNDEGTFLSFCVSFDEVWWSMMRWVVGNASVLTHLVNNRKYQF